MAYERLDEVTGVGKTITNRDKYTRSPFTVGMIMDEVSVSDGEQKYFIQLVRLADGLACDGDPTRHVFRIGYYTQRTDGWFCLGSQFSPTVTPSELHCLIQAIKEKGWLETGVARK
jgi:hypothetical protein